MPNYENLNAQQGKYVIPALRTSNASGASASHLRPLASMQSKDSFIPRWGNGFIVAQPDVSESFVKKAIKLVETLPKPILRIFQNSGCQIKLASTMDKIFPDVANDPVVNANGKSWQQYGGIAEGKLIGVPELTRRKGAPLGPYSAADPELYELRHELGHVWHNVTSVLYNEDGTVKDEFGRAYVNDVRRFSPEKAKEFSYYVRRNSNGKLSHQGMRETAAEIWAALYGGGTKEEDEMLRAFPRTAEYMRNATKAIVRAMPK